MHPEWEERKRRVEAEVLGQSEGPRKIQFRQGGRSVEGRAARRQASIRASRRSTLRAALIVVVLLYMTYQAILWVGASDYGGFLEFMKANG